MFPFLVCRHGRHQGTFVIRATCMPYQKSMIKRCTVHCCVYACQADANAQSHQEHINRPCSAIQAFLQPKTGWKNDIPRACLSS